MATTTMHGRQLRDDTVPGAKLIDGDVALAKLAELVVQADGGQPFTGEQSMGGNKLTNVGTPTVASDATTKAYVDNLTLGFAWKDNVRAATTANVALSGTQTIDGVALAADQRVLVKNQTAPEENGIYLVKGGAWVRTTDADAWDELVSATVVVDEGTVNADTYWRSTINAGGTLDTTAVVWDDLPGPQDILVDDTATLDLTKTGNTITGTVLDSPTLEGQDSAFHLDRANHTGDINGPLLIDEPDAGETAPVLTVKNNAVQEFNQVWKDDAGVNRLAVRSNDHYGINAVEAIGGLIIGASSAADLFDRGVLQFTDTGNPNVHLHNDGASGLQLDDAFANLYSSGASGVQIVGSAGPLSVDTTGLGFFNATPVVQQNADTVADLWTALKAYGLLDTASDAPTIPDTEAIQDIIGAMVSGNTETNIAVTYDDTNGKLDFVVTVASNRVVRETPTGVVDGANTTFVLADAPAAGSEEVFLNGILQEPGGGNDYTISGDTITYLTAPETGDKLRVSYVPA